LNAKLNISVVPSWNGKGETIIPYVITMSSLAMLSPLMERQLGQMAPSRFTDRALKWWTSLPEPSRREFSRDWPHLLNNLRRTYLTDQWVRDRNKEFEEMKFRQQGHEVEDPVDFFQRRAQYHSFIFSDTDDGPTAVSRLIRTQPAEWNKEVNERMCPTIDSLMEVAQHSQASLMSTWVLTNKVDRLLASPSANPAAPRTRFRPRAHVANVEVEGRGIGREGGGEDGHGSRPASKS
jgi:hypothetical protein